MLDALTADMNLSDYTAVKAEDGNRLVFCRRDGSEEVKQWADRSRAESWAEEMKQQARQRTAERYAKEKSNIDGKSITGSDTESNIEIEKNTD